MYAFEGDFRRKPAQSLGGQKSSEERSSLLQRAQEERRKREEGRLRIISAVKIQAFYRGHSERKKMQEIHRTQFDQTCRSIENKTVNIDTLMELCRQLNFFYHRFGDGQRLTWLCQLLVLHSSSVPDCLLLRSTLQLCLSYISDVCHKDVAIGGPLRALEVFCLKHYNVLVYLVNNGLLDCLKNVLESRLPHLIESQQAPTIMADALYKLIIHPVKAHCPGALGMLWTTFFGISYSDAAKHYVLPALVADSSLDVNELIKDLISSGTVHENIFHSLLKIIVKRIDDVACVNDLLYLLGTLCKSVTLPSDQDDDEEDDVQPCVIDECMRLLDDINFINKLLNGAEPSSMKYLCDLCHLQLKYHRLKVNRSRFLSTLSFRYKLLSQMWDTCLSITSVSVTGTKTALVTLIQRSIIPDDESAIIPSLTSVCQLYLYGISPLHDNELNYRVLYIDLVSFCQCLRDISVGIIEILHPEISNKRGKMINQSEWTTVFSAVVQLVKLLYIRDSQLHFCPSNHWLIPAYGSLDQSRQFFQSIGSWGLLSDDEVSNHLLSTKEVRKLTILREIPFVIAFQQRVEIFQRLISDDKQEFHDGHHYVMSPSVIVRRNFLYEDAFDKLSSENIPNLRPRLQVELINFAGLNEAGIDGGGIFREFIMELLRTSFDPNRGFFIYTYDQRLYPNPNISKIVPDFPKHYYFLGRMLGKALYEYMMVELPLAMFFLSKLLSRHKNVDFHHLKSLDPQIYKNLLFLKSYDGDFEDLQLDFSVTHNILGEVEVIDLKPGGRGVKVTRSNYIEYMHLMADYLLNRQIQTQTDAFRSGIADVINIQYLQMFNQEELQVLISGAPQAIDVEDLMIHSAYSGGYALDHPTIVMLWKVVSDFTEQQKRKFLKFVTSCSRPPLLGFKDLYPSFCVHFAGHDTDRLPTASTCMNLLKLPEFKDIEMLRTKLLYAIESESGFELS